jgi:type III secretory pathway component EscS
LSDHAHAAGPSLVDRKLPPVTEIGAASMIAIAGGVIFNASYLPRHAPLAGAISLLIVAAALVVVNVFILTRIEEFARQRFMQVAGWSLLAYAVIGGMIEYAFVYDHTRGSQLLILTLMLVLFVINVPILIGFTVARYARADER